MLQPSTDLVQIARVLKSNGTDGEMVLGLSGIEPEELNSNEPVFIYFDGSPVPFFVESVRQRGQRKVLVRLTGIHSLEDADEILGEGVYVEPSFLPAGNGEDEDLSFLCGWTLYDGAIAPDAMVGRISSYMDIPGNPCVEVGSPAGTVMIPLHKDLILSVDPASRVIVMAVPKGLV